MWVTNSKELNGKLIRTAINSAIDVKVVYASYQLVRAGAQAFLIWKSATNPWWLALNASHWKGVMWLWADTSHFFSDCATCPTNDAALAWPSNGQIERYRIWEFKGLHLLAFKEFSRIYSFRLRAPIQFPDNWASSPLLTQHYPFHLLGTHMTFSSSFTASTGLHKTLPDKEVTPMGDTSSSERIESLDDKGEPKEDTISSTPESRQKPLVAIPEAIVNPRKRSKPNPHTSNPGPSAAPRATKRSKYPLSLIHNTLGFPVRWLNMLPNITLKRKWTTLPMFMRFVTIRSRNILLLGRVGRMKESTWILGQIATILSTHMSISSRNTG